MWLILVPLSQLLQQLTALTSIISINWVVLAPGLIPGVIVAARSVIMEALRAVVVAVEIANVCFGMSPPLVPEPNLSLLRFRHQEHFFGMNRWTNQNLCQHPGVKKIPPVFTLLMKQAWSFPRTIYGRDVWIVILLSRIHSRVQIQWIRLQQCDLEFNIFTKEPVVWLDWKDFSLEKISININCINDCAHK